MDVILSQEVQAGLAAARKRATKGSHRLRIEDGADSYPVLRAWENGFALKPLAHRVPRGRVALYDGAQLLSYCLIVASEEDGDELHFEYKRITDASLEQPLDFYRAPDSPVALLGHA